MRNIHILPTDKTSRLYINVLGYLSFDSLQFRVSNQNIYITNDEEIKDGDFCFHFNHKSIMKIGVGEGKLMKGHTYLKKIILTTDLELQKDGVQAIDNEFLERLIKNPNYEEVGVDWVDFSQSYFIKIPEEETTLKLPSLPYEYDPLINKNQETLEEVSEMHFEWTKDDETLTCKDHFISDAKWQQERSYSEDDMNEYSEYCTKIIRTMSVGYPWLTPKKWFEQFKKQIK